MLVTPLYAALLTFWFLVLTLAVIRERKRGFALGDGGDPAMQRVIRGHANFAEYVPLALLMMALLELARHSIYLLHALGVTLLVARLLHGYAFAFRRRWMFGRVWGAALTLLVLAVEAVMCLYQAILGHELWLGGLL